MELIAQTGPRGEVVTANACTLNGAIDASQTTLTLSHSGVFSNGDLVTIGKEDITLTTISGTTVSVCVRGVGTTDGATHASGMNIRLAAGTTLLSHTFDGAEKLSLIKAGGDVSAMFAYEEAGTIKDFDITTGFLPAAFNPGNQWTVPDGTTIKVLVWLFGDKASEAVFWAKMQE